MSSESKHKLYDYEVTPPSRVWERIARELDESDLAYDYPSRLAEMEMTPPVAAWHAITQTLDADKQTKATAPARRIPLFVRYAAAAAVIGFLIWAGAGILNKKSKNDDIVVKGQPTTSPVIVTQPVVTNPGDDITSVRTDSIDEEKRNEDALEKSKRTFAKLTVPVRSKIRNAADFHFSIDYVEPISAEELDPATRYVVMMTPEGHFVRMSKKLGDLVCCVSGEVQDKECVDQLKKWRDKMASSSLAYSPGNFGDILNLVKSLQE